MLEDVRSSGGVFAPTIRFHDGRFYMTTTNNSTNQHFIVYTDDIHGEWSDPIYIEQGGIDPSLLFIEDKVYFTSNGDDDFGDYGIIQSEIDIKTGMKLTPSKVIWKGTGGRFIEGPHLYYLNDMYYLFVSEGGTEYGHMMTYARSENPYGPFEPFPNNPVLTNRNLGGFEIQGVGHADLIQNLQGDWFFIHLGFRQIGRWFPFHHLGRETFLTPVSIDKNGWFYVPNDGTTKSSYEIKGNFKQERKDFYSFDQTDIQLDWNFIRHPEMSRYILTPYEFILKGSKVSLDAIGSPTFVGIRQVDFNMFASCDVEINEGEAGITIYMDENHHFDVSIKKEDNEYVAIGRLNIGTARVVTKSIRLSHNYAKLIIKAKADHYEFYVNEITEDSKLSWVESRYVSSEVALGFTGVFIGLYAYDPNEENISKFRNFNVRYVYE